MSPVLAKIEFSQSFQEMFDDLATFIPKLVAAIVVFLVGWFIARTLRKVIHRGLTKMGVDGKFVKDVKESLTPNTSALFIIVREADPTAALALLRNYNGRVLQTTLDSEAEENLRRSLGDSGEEA